MSITKHAKKMVVTLAELLAIALVWIFLTGLILMACGDF